MSLLNNVYIQKGEGGLGRRTPSEDNIRGLVMNGGTAMPAGLAVDTSTVLYSVEDAKALGIDAAYDTAQKVLLFYHISEFFRINPNGQLWLRLVPSTTKLVDMVDVAAVSPCAALQLARDSDYRARFIAVGLNPAQDYSPIITDGIDSDVLAAIPKAEALSEQLFNEHGPCGILIEGRSFNGTSAAAPSLRILDSEGVSVVIAQDLDVANAATTGGNTQANAHAAIGTALGTSSKARVHENIGWVEKFNIQDAGTGRFLNPGLSSHLPLKSYSESSLTTLNDKGYILCRQFTGQPGVYWNDSHTCTGLDSDYAYMENVATINKAVREVYKALVPRINGPVKVSADGKLSPEVIASFDSTARSGLQNMLIDEEISGYDVWIDPDQDIISTSELKVRIRILPIGSARWITVDIGFTKSLS